jgi:hypothetical protein
VPGVQRLRAGIVSLEAAASTVRNYQLGGMPGLLQTENHAKTLFEKLSKRPDKQAVENQIRVRMNADTSLQEKSWT